MVSYDVELLDRLRDQLGGEPGVTERAMFGGVAMMVNGHMCVGVMKGGGLMVRLAAEEGAAALEEPHTRVMDFTGRPMKGWIIVDRAGYADDAALEAWVDRGLRHVRTLPPKNP